MANPQLRLMILAFPITSYLILGRLSLTLIDLSSQLSTRLWNFAIADRLEYQDSLKDDRGLVLTFPVMFPVLSLLALSSLLWCMVLVVLKIAKRQTLLDRIHKLLADEVSLIIALPAQSYQWLQGVVNEIFAGIELLIAPVQVEEATEEITEHPEEIAPSVASPSTISSVPEIPDIPQPLHRVDKEIDDKIDDKIDRDIEADVSIPTYPTNPDVPLNSDSGIDYTRLRDLLADRNWQQGNNETIEIILRATRRQDERWLDALNLDELPCTEFDTINQLWVQYSGGQFGFSVQCQIYEQGDGDYGTFCDRIGWRKDNQWLQPEDLNYTNSAPKGHLPYLGSLIGYSLLIHKLRACQLS